MNQVVTFTATEANAASWVWDFGDGTTATGRTVQHAFTQLGGPNVVMTVHGDGTNTIGDSASTIGFTIIDPAVLYLNDRRFEVRTSWVSSGQGTSGVGTAVQLTPDTGYFWFFSPSNLEVVVKVLDACTVDGYFWVFGGGLTNLGVQMTVLDTFTGVSKVYSNAEGQAFQPIQDTRFEACPAVTGSSASTRAAAAPSVALSAPTPATPVTGDAVSFTATPSGFADDAAVTYKWDFGDCPPVVRSCPAQPGDATKSHQYQSAGTFTVTVTATQGGQTAVGLGTRDGHGGLADDSAPVRGVHGSTERRAGRATSGRRRSIRRSRSPPSRPTPCPTRGISATGAPRRARPSRTRSRPPAARR